MKSQGLGYRELRELYRPILYRARQSKTEHDKAIESYIELWRAIESVTVLGY